MTIDLESALRTAACAARAGGQVLLAGFAASDKRAEEKSHRHDPVTIYDRRSETEILSVIGRAYPDHAVLSEERGASGDTDGPTWVVDPLDGTNNFLRGVPHFAVSIALRAGRESLVACVYDPIRRELFTATRDGDARRNGDPIAVSDQPGLDGSVIAVGLSHHPDRRARSIARLPGLADRPRALRTTGSAALDLAYVAAGRFDAAWYLSLCDWDVAAGILLVERAGGRVVDPNGDRLVDPLDGLIASNGRVEAELRHALESEGSDVERLP
jgi:myo-inositol-1(or 4)-monophosphatase